MAKDTYVFTHVGHKLYPTAQFGINMQAWVVFFFKNIAQTLAVLINEIGECLFLLRGTRNQLKRFLAVCNFVFSISISALLEFN